MEPIVLKVNGMTCGGCVKSVKRVVEAKTGAEPDVTLDLDRLVSCAPSGDCSPSTPWSLALHGGYGGRTHRPHGVPSCAVSTHPTDGRETHECTTSRPPTAIDSAPTGGRRRTRRLPSLSCSTA